MDGAASSSENKLLTYLSSEPVTARDQDLFVQDASHTTGHVLSGRCNVIKVDSNIEDGDTSNDDELNKGEDALGGYGARMEHAWEEHHEDENKEGGRRTGNRFQDVKFEKILVNAE